MPAKGDIQGRLGESLPLAPRFRGDDGIRGGGVICQVRTIRFHWSPQGPAFGLLEDMPRLGYPATVGPGLRRDDERNRRCYGCIGPGN